LLKRFLNLFFKQTETEIIKIIYLKNLGKIIGYRGKFPPSQKQIEDFEEKGLKEISYE